MDSRGSNKSALTLRSDPVCASVRYVVVGGGCDERHFQCGGSDPECQSYLFMCDGKRDCRNGADEALCGKLLSSNIHAYI